MRYHLHLITGFTRETLERFLYPHVNDDFVISENLTDSNRNPCKSIVLAFASVEDRDHVQSLFRVRGHRLAPRSKRVEHYSAVA
jgi:hypothetical protein